MSKLFATGTPTVPQRTPVVLGRRLLRNPVAVISLAWLVLVVVAAVLAPLLAPVDPNFASINDVFAAPSAAHLLGADSAGRDILSRLMFASQFSLAGAFVALATAALIGVSSGLTAGYYGGWFDGVSSWFTGMLMSLPGIVVLLAARAVLGPSLWISMLIFGVLISPAFFRLVVAAVRGVRSELYVDAARVAGLPDRSIIGRHILVVVRAPIIIQAALVAGIAIGVQAGIEFLGFGDLSVPTWGSMLNEGFANLYRAPFLVLWPSLMVALTSVSLAMIATAMRDALEQSPAARRTPRRRAAEPMALTVGAVEQLVVSNLSVGYPTAGGADITVVNEVSLTLRRGEVHGLIGESGSGKTQTAFAILKLLPDGGAVTGGSLVFDGRNLADLDEKAMTSLRGRRIAYIPQEPMSNLDPSFTIGSQLVEPLRKVMGLSRAAARERALSLLERVGIPDPAKTFAAYPHEISGGMAQRVLIAGAVSCDPELLIADEPTTALDVTVQAEVLDLLRDLQRERGMTVLLVTHNFGVVADLCDRVSVMRSGRIVESGTVRDIFHNPQHEYTRSLLAAILEDGPARAPYAEVAR